MSDQPGPAEPGAPAQAGRPQPAAPDFRGEPGAPETHPGRRPWPQLRPEEWRNELVHLVDDAAQRVQAATVASVTRAAKPEARWPVSGAVLLAILLQLQLPARFAVLQPAYLLPVLEAALVVGLVAANPKRFERYSRPVRAASVALVTLISLANALSAGLLVRDIIFPRPGRPLFGPSHAPELLATGAAIWATNVIAFALWYWEFDRGGPVRRAQGMSKYPDLLFPQMTVPELTRPGWDAQFIDYLYLSFTNATAFSPTDVMPLTRWAKLTMAVQSAVSLAVGALVIARSINILRG